MKWTKEQIEQYKSKYGRLHLIKIPAGDGKEAIFLARPPKKAELQALSSKTDPADYNELMFNIMIVDGDRQYIDDTPDFDAGVYLALVQELGKLLMPKPAESKPL